MFNLVLKRLFKKRFRDSEAFFYGCHYSQSSLATQPMCVCRGRVWAAIVCECDGAAVWDQKSKNGLLSSESPKTVWVEWWKEFTILPSQL